VQLLPRLGLLFASLALVLVAGELFVRTCVGPVPPRNLTIVPAAIRAEPPFEGVPYVLRPDARVPHAIGADPRGYLGEEGTLVYRTNSLGLRDEEVAREKPPGVFRIVGLGDSFTFGTGVRQEDLYLERLEAALAADAGRTVEVLNLGVPGYNTAHEVALLRHFGLSLGPDLLILCYVVNDAEVIVPRPRARPPRGGPPRSLLVAHLRHRLDTPRVQRRAIESTRRDHAPGAPGWALVRRKLAEAATLSRERGVPLVLVIFPNLWELDDYPFAEVHAKVAAVGRRLGLPVLDLHDAFRGRDGPSLWVHPANQHPNEEAHAIAAEALAAFLRERELVPE